MGKIFYTHDEIIGRPHLEGKDRSLVHFHFRPARPANFCVTLDPDTQEVKRQLTEICRMLAWQEWQELHAYLSDIVV